MDIFILDAPVPSGIREKGEGISFVWHKRFSRLGKESISPWARISRIAKTSGQCLP
jgi:hypothetical protein